MQFFLGKSIEEVPLGKRIYLPVLDKKFHADLISDLYTEKFEEDTTELYRRRETIMNPFPLNKSFDDFIDFITSKKSTNFMVRAVNTFERNNVEEQNSATNPVVIDDSGDEDNFEFPDVHVEDSTSGKKGPRTKTTPRTIPSNQPLDDKQQSPKKGTKKRERKTKVRKEK